MWKITKLLHYCQENTARASSGKWVPAKPLTYWNFKRIKSAFLVLIGKADAFTWDDQ